MPPGSARDQRRNAGPRRSGPVRFIKEEGFVMPPERAIRLTGHRWNKTNERRVVCLMARPEFDATGQPCSGQQ